MTSLGIEHAKADPSAFRAAITPYLCVKSAAEAIDFYRRAFDALERLRIPGENGRIGHATLEINGAELYLADEHPEIDVLSPTTIGGSPVLLHLTVVDLDAALAQAVDAGATVVRPIQDSGQGVRNAKIRDPFGHNWMLWEEIR